MGGQLFLMQLASIPSPSTGTISIGPIALNAYGLMIALGVMAGLWLLGRQLEKSHLGTRDDASAMGLWGVLGGVIGARAYHVVTDWSRFSDDLASIPKIWQGGLGIPGGLLVGIVVGAWQANRRGVRPAVALTFAMPAIALAQSIGRWGNWFNQELYGKPTGVPWALEIDSGRGYASGTTFHPTFLYESLWALGLCGVLLLVQRRHQLAAGRLLGVYLIGYGTGRFWIEGLRIDPAHSIGGLRLNQWVALSAVVAGTIYLLATHGRKWSETGTDNAADAELSAEVGDSDLSTTVATRARGRA